MVATLVELSDVQWAWAKFDIPLSSFIYSRLAPLQKKVKANDQTKSNCAIKLLGSRSNETSQKGLCKPLGLEFVSAC